MASIGFPEHRERRPDAGSFGEDSKDQGSTLVHRIAQESSRESLLFHKFTRLRARILLRRQNQLIALENEISKLDTEYHHVVEVVTPGQRQIYKQLPQSKFKHLDTVRTPGSSDDNVEHPSEQSSGIGTITVDKEFLKEMERKSFAIVKPFECHSSDQLSNTIITNPGERFVLSDTGGRTVDVVSCQVSHKEILSAKDILRKEISTWMDKSGLSPPLPPPVSQWFPDLPPAPARLFGDESLQHPTMTHTRITFDKMLAAQSESSHALQPSGDLSPATKQSLSELDIQSIITNVKLRHDVNFDRDLSFRPSSNDGKPVHNPTKIRFICTQLCGSEFRSKLEWQRHERDCHHQEHSTELELLATIGTGAEVAAYSKHLKDADMRKSTGTYPSPIEKYEAGMFKQDRMERVMEKPYFRPGRVFKMLWPEPVGAVDKPPVSHWGRHGDIKPQNILWFGNDRNSQGSLKVTDFGLSKTRRTWSAESPSRVFEIPSVLGKGHFTDALGDYCAKSNFMREEYAVRLGLSINRQDTSDVVVGSGKKVTTAGTTETLFRFKDENKSYSLKFHLLPSCLHNVILGRSFIKFTRTFSSMGNKLRRVKERVLNSVSHHFLYLGESAPRFEGLIHGVPGDALADSGAKVLVMDEAYARSRGFPIATGFQHRTKLRFADDSVAYTSGITYGVQWEFGPGGKSEQYSLDFHILKNAPANVILSDTFLFDTHAYSEYDCYLIDDDDDDDDAFFFAIDIDTTHNGHESSNQASLADMKYFELVRRGEEEDRISHLSPEEQIIAWQVENERRAEWERLRLALELSQSTPPRPSPASTSPILGQSPPTPSSGGGQQADSHPGPRKRSRWWFKLKRRAPT